MLHRYGGGGNMGGEEEPDAFDDAFREDAPGIDPAKADTVEGCYAAAAGLFREIEQRFGQREARRIFRLCGKPAPPDHEVKKLEVVGLYWSMLPWPNKLLLAKQLTEKNKEL